MRKETALGSACQVLSGVPPSGLWAPFMMSSELALREGPVFMQVKPVNQAKSPVRVWGGGESGKGSRRVCGVRPFVQPPGYKHTLS